MSRAQFTGEVSEEELEDLFEESARHGAILATLYFDAHGPSREGIENSLIDFVGRLTKERGVLYCKGEIDPALETEEPTADGLAKHLMYSCSTRVRILTEDFSTLLNLCLKYGPLAAEIELPHEIRLSMEEAQSLLLDASQSTQDYVQYIMTKTMKEDEKQKLQEHLRRRSEIAEKIKKRAQGKPESED
ncbi:hypothetical protein HY994_05970 [Candidatus Micrarchaeota archaeon]|nr:hypothetical protein [Candidatus Micrarchaeota archaeon]